MGLEHEIEHYIHRHDWDIDYDDGVVKSIWGTEWKVSIERNDDYWALTGITYPVEKEIVLRESADLRIATTLYESKSEDMAYTLAHELGHADTWPISVGLPYIILGLGIAAAVKSKSGKPILGSLAGVVASKVILDELLAETAATVFHDTPFLKGLYLCAPDFIGAWNELTHMF